MDKHTAIILFAIIGILAIGIIAGMAYKKPLSPEAQLADATAILKSACTYACAGKTVGAQISMPAGSSIYTTQDAVCTKMGNKLFCGTCPCTLANATITTPNATPNCVFHIGEPLVLTCN